MKMIEKIVAISAKAALKAATTAAGIPSMGGVHQPAEPANLKEVVKNHRG